MRSFDADETSPWPRSVGGLLLRNGVPNPVSRLIATGHTSLLAFLIAACWPLAVAAQGFDTTRVGIHQAESSLHRWDILNADSLFPELKDGKAEAQRGNLEEAEAQFKNGLKNYQRAAYFNLGVLAYEQQHFKKALSFFRKCATIEKDSTILDYIQNAQRLLKARQKHR